MCDPVCVVQFVSECCYVINVRHISVDDITYRFITEVISIIDIDSKKVITTISVDTYIFGMAIRGRTIYYSAWSKGLKMLNNSTPSVFKNATICFL
jgi:hypothetical protein